MPDESFLTKEKLILRRPNLMDKMAILEMIKEFQLDKSEMDGCFIDEKLDYEHWLESNLKSEQGVDLPEGFVSAVQFVSFDETGKKNLVGTFDEKRVVLTAYFQDLNIKIKDVEALSIIDLIKGLKKVEATEEEVNAELDRTALMYGMDREGLIAEVRKSGNYARFIDDIKYQIVNRKTVDLLAK